MICLIQETNGLRYKKKISEQKHGNEQIVILLGLFSVIKEQMKFDHIKIKFFEVKLGGQLQFSPYTL